MLPAVGQQHPLMPLTASDHYGKHYVLYSPGWCNPMAVTYVMYRAEV